MITNADREEGVEVSQDHARSTFAAERPATEASAATDLRDFLDSVAAIPLDPADLSYTATNVFYGRGSLAKEVRRDASIAIRTLREAIKAARALKADLGGVA